MASRLRSLTCAAVIDLRVVDNLWKDYDYEFVPAELPLS